MKRYIATGKPLTEYEREHLIILGEECAEVIKAAAKILRFGKDNLSDEVVPRNSSRELGLECGDLRCMVSKCTDLGLMTDADINEGFHSKEGRLEIYLQNVPGKPTSIKLTPAEIQSGLDRVRWAEGLIRQLPETHDGRNSWLMNYGQKERK